MKRGSKRITLKDLARHLNVSMMTVSRALNDHPDINQKTKERIIKLANELDYRPDSIARSLVQKRTYTIGIVVPEITYSFFPGALKGIEEVLFSAGYDIILTCSNEKAEREEQILKNLESKRVEGILISAAQDADDIYPYERIIKKGIPLVFFDRSVDGLNCSSVVVDDERGAFKIVEHLIQLGYQKIAHISGFPGISISRDRLEGYKRALKKCKIPVNKSYIVQSAFNEESGYKAMKSLLKLEDPPEAVFAVNDPVAIGAYMAIKEEGLKVPRDIALVGFADIATASILEVPLTTVYQPAYMVGKRAAERLLTELEGEGEVKPEKIVLKTRLMIRKSCGSI
ncbi:MAG: LacI family DNA-binding transcriptional regulator [Fidelibacterota bacterium]